MRIRGFSLVETMVVVAIAAIVLAIAVPSFQEVIANGRSRGVAESIQFGLIKARSDAIARNAPMRFQLVSTMESGCALSSSSRLWVVTQYTGATTPANTRGVPTGVCHVNAYMPTDQEEPCPGTLTLAAYNAAGGNATNCLVDPFISYKGTAENVPNVVVAATPVMGASAGFVVTFGPLGQLLANLEMPTPPITNPPTTNPAYRVDVGPAAGVAGLNYCVQVNSNGNTRLCATACPCA